MSLDKIIETLQESREGIDKILNNKSSIKNIKRPQS